MDIDLPAQLAGRGLSGVEQVVGLGGADDEHFEVVGTWPGCSWYRAAHDP